MTDPISRQTAIDTALRAINDLQAKDPLRDEYIISEMEEIPSAEQRGKWIRTGEDGYCSVCKCDMPMFRNDWEWKYIETRYCPNCGARMKK